MYCVDVGHELEIRICSGGEPKNTEKVPNLGIYSMTFCKKNVIF